MASSRRRPHVFDSDDEELLDEMMEVVNSDDSYDDENEESGSCDECEEQREELSPADGYLRRMNKSSNKRGRSSKRSKTQTGYELQ